MFSGLSTSFFVGASLDLVMAIIGLVCVWIIFKEKMDEINEEKEDEESR